MIDDKDQRIADLENAIKIQASAVKTLEAAEDRELNKLRKQEVDMHQALRQLESEREMNAILTNEIEQLRVDINEAFIDGAADERAKILAWLNDHRGGRALVFAKLIEAGEHLK
jgi:RecA/RadA recombinase